MAVTDRRAHSWAVLFLGWLLYYPAVQAGLIPIEYCSTLSTAMTPTNTSIYQSQGLCFDFCKVDYAVGIVQGDACWCSNFIPDPSTQLDIKKCDKTCIGFPGDLCGDVEDGTFVYVKGFKEPEGVRKVGQQLPTTKPPDKNGPAPTTGPPSVSTVTLDGVVKTVTVPGTTGTGLANQGEITSQNNGGLGTGATVGIAIGVVLIVIIAMAIAFFVWRRKRQQADDADDHDDMAAVGAGGHLRRASSGGFTSEKIGPGSVGRRPTMQSSHHPEGSLHSDSSARRRSHLMPIDPRIDPGHSGIYARDENASHDSINTLRDDQDYSRRVHAPKVLRATNPDPDY